MENKTECEKCSTSLSLGSIAFICSYECTFCEKCSKEMNFICANCSGELVRRPRRSEAKNFNLNSILIFTYLIDNFEKFF